MFYNNMELAEDRSFKIPSLSDDEEVQLDPKREKALSGSFGYGSSRNSAIYSGRSAILQTILISMQ